MTAIGNAVTGNLQLPNGVDFIVVLFALILNGAVPMLMLHAHRQREILHVAGLAQAHWYLSNSQAPGIAVPIGTLGSSAQSLQMAKGAFNRLAELLAIPQQ